MLMHDLWLSQRRIPSLSFHGGPNNAAREIDEVRSREDSPLRDKADFSAAFMGGSRERGEIRTVIGDHKLSTCEKKKRDAESVKWRGDRRILINTRIIITEEAAQMFTTPVE